MADKSPMSRPSPEPLDLCPFVDADEATCASHFRLEGLSRAFGDCIGGYRGCAHYWRLMQTDSQRLRALTFHGQRKPLQPTGS